MPLCVLRIMLAVKVKEWLRADGAYTDGLDLLKQLSRNAFLISILEGGENLYNRIRLRDELEKYSAMLPEPTQAADHDFMMMPPEVQEVVKQAKAHFKAMKMQRDFLFSDDKEVRRVAALQILSLSQLNKECWAKVEYWRKYKALPAEVSTEGLERIPVAELVRMRDLDRNYIWKHEKKLEGLSGEKKQRLAERIQERRVRLSTIELKLSKLPNE